MKLYSSLNKQVIEINEEIVNIYNCGPTVYNDIHIGNARPLIVFDVLHRMLLASNKKVNFLHNLTDIDDKIIKAANAQNITESALTTHYANEYADIRARLNILSMNIQKVTDHITGLIDYIDRLVQANVAYEVNGNVYFDTAKINEYGILSNRKLEEQEVGERVAVDDAKHNETDFVLWKKTNYGIQWASPWSMGRPGWHSECSYLIEKYFGDKLTIHGGGIDLKFPHHENENAQHLGLHHCGIAKIWMHIGHVNINRQKMSKSLNNFILVKDILGQYEANVLRWFMYQSNYRNPIDYNLAVMQACQTDINKFKQSLSLAKTYIIGNNMSLLKPTHNYVFLEHLKNDLNITNAITVLQAFIKQINIYLRQKDYQNLATATSELEGSLNILGIEFENLHQDHNNQSLIKQYFSALANKDYTTSDELRNTLIKNGLL